MGAIPVCAGKTVVSAYHGFRWIVGSSDEETTLILERPPQLEPQTRIEDTIIQDWRWLALRCERRLIAQAKRKGPSRRVAEVLGEHFDIDQFACFVPRTVLEAIADNRIRYSDDFDIIIENFNAAVVFCDASGFTALTEALDKQANGAEKLGECINNFFAPLIQIVNFWGGDIIKFSGDALTIVWPVDDEMDADEEKVYPEGTTQFRIDQTKACRLACQCCLDLHNNLNHFPTPVAGKFFTLHIGVGYGRVTILQVGGTLDRWEYVVAGPPMQEISIAEPLASSGETVVSPTVVAALGGEVGARFEFIEEMGYAKIFELRGEKVNPPPPLENIILQDTDVELLKRFIPPAVFKRLTAGYNVFINELRRVSVVFVGVHGLDVSTDRGSHAAHRLMQLTQKAAYTMEGSVNKFLVDDKGVLILIMFGLPPVYHLDDALRAVMAALRVVDGLKMLGLTAGIGVATGRVWCGTVGCDLRKEYTAMGDTVNLSARLMGKAQSNEINCDLETRSLCDHVMDFRALPPVKMKGKANLVPVFQPTGQMRRQAVLQTTTGEPISTWARWKYKRRLYKILFPGYEYRHPILDFDKPPLDYPIKSGPLFSWEYVEPWMSSLRPTVDIGGVAVIAGKETEGTTELVQYVSELARNLGRSVFLCSNMPDSTHVNIGNVPLLAWRKLCTEMIEKWRWAPSRDSKGYSKVDRDNSMYGLAKELIHPIFHWRLHEMKSVLHGLVLPYEVPENQLMDREREKMPKSRQDKTGLSKVLKKASNFVAALKKEERYADSMDEEDDDDDEYSGSKNPFLPSYVLQDQDEQSLAPVICSLVNGFSMYECSVVVLHVRSGTSLFASMDSESWKVARLVGRIAMMRRRRKIELDMKDLKKWRRKHSRGCLWCRGTAEPYRQFNGDLRHPKWTSRCKPPPSKYFPPFIFLLVCSDMTGHVPEQQELIEWAKESNCFVQMKKMSPVETGSYLAHCLSVPRRALPDELIEYVYRISAGIPKYVFLTARQLMTEQAIIIEEVSAASKSLQHRDTVIKRHEHYSGANLRQFGSRSDSKRFVPPADFVNGISEKLLNGTEPKPAEDVDADGTQVESRKAENFELHGQLLTGKSGIPEGASTTEDDSEHSDDPVRERLHGGKSKFITVYKFKQHMQLEAPVLIPRDPSTRRLSTVSNGSVGKDEYSAPKLAIDELRVSQMCKVNPDEELDLVDGLYVRKSRRRSRKGEKDEEEDKNGEQDPREAMHRAAFTKGFQQRTDDILRYGRSKYETPVRDMYATQPGKDDTLREPDWESHDQQFRDRSHPNIRKPYLPPGPELFTSRVGQLAFVPEFTPNYETSIECQTKGNRMEKMGSEAHSFGPLTKIKSLEAKPVKVRVIKDLKKVPFVSELRAAAMSLMERLEPDEQLAAKVASVFPVAFTGFELQAVYPRPMTPESFQRMIDNLITKEMLENCEPPSEDQLQELDLVPLQPVEKGSAGAAAAVAAQSRQRRLRKAENGSDVSSDESLVSEIEPVANRWGFDDDGSPVFYRFTSIAFQHVVADLLMSAERSFLARISRKVICFRRTYGLSFLMKQINAKLIDSPMDCHEDIEEELSVDGSKTATSNYSAEVLYFLTIDEAVNVRGASIASRNRKKHPKQNIIFVDKALTVVRREEVYVNPIQKKIFIDEILSSL